VLLSKSLHKQQWSLPVAVWPAVEGSGNWFVWVQVIAFDAKPEPPVGNPAEDKPNKTMIARPEREILSRALWHEHFLLAFFEITKHFFEIAAAS